jgi:hypothetical protein
VVVKVPVSLRVFIAWPRRVPRDTSVLGMKYGWYCPGKPEPEKLTTGRLMGFGIACKNKRGDPEGRPLIAA